MTTRRLDLFAVQAQMALEDYRTAGEFARRMGGLFETVSSMRARGRMGGFCCPALVVFPDFIGTPLLFTPYFRRVADAASLEEAAARILRHQAPRILYLRARHRVGAMQALLLLLARRAYECYFRTFSSLARRHQVAVVAGSLPVPNNRFGQTGTFQLIPEHPEIYHQGLTFNARGEVIHVARKVNVVQDFDARLGLTPGRIEDVRPFELAGARVGNFLCYDGFVRGSSERLLPLESSLVAQRLEIVVQPGASVRAWDAPWPLAAEREPRSQADAWHAFGLSAMLERHPDLQFGVNPMLNARFFELTFEGRSSIVGRDWHGQCTVLASASSHGADVGCEQILKVEAHLPERVRLRPETSFEPSV